MSIEMTPQYETKLFSDIYYSYERFKNDYTTLGIPETISLDSLKTAYFLIYARYGNNPIANLDENQWRFKIFSVIFQYGPTWEKKLDIQKTLREMSEEDLLKGSKAIYNHAFNPSSAPSTQSLEELNYINDQNTSHNKRGKLEAYGFLWSLLETDVTEDFINKFRFCFKQFVKPERPLLYITEEEEEEA